MSYLNVVTGEFPRFDGDLELLGWTVGQELPENWVKVIQDPMPEITDGQTYEVNKPKLIEGVWKVTWNVRNLTQKEIESISNNKLEMLNLFK
jgi:hypothetical protein